MKKSLKILSVSVFSIMLSGCGAVNPVPGEGYTQEQIKEVMKIDQMIVRPVTFSSDAKKLMTMEGTFENDLYSFDLRTGLKTQLYNNEMDQKQIEEYLDKVDWEKELEGTQSYKHLSSEKQSKFKSAFSTIDSAQQDDRFILDARYSPNGEKVAMIANIYGWKTVYSTFDITTKRVNILHVFPDPKETPTRATPAGISWKGDDKVIYGFQDSKGYLIYEYTLSTKVNRLLLDANKATRVYFSPDGSKVAYYVPIITKSSMPGLEDKVTEELWIANGDFSNPLLISDYPALMGTTTWSNDGKYLLFHNGDKDSMAPKMILALYDVDSKKTTLIAGDRINASGFTPDNKIVFTWDNRIFQTDIHK